MERIEDKLYNELLEKEFHIHGIVIDFYRRHGIYKNAYNKSILKNMLAAYATTDLNDIDYLHYFDKFSIADSTKTPCENYERYLYMIIDLLEIIKNHK